MAKRQRDISSAHPNTLSVQLTKPGIERVQARADISRSALGCHSKKTRASIAKPPNSAQLEETPTTSPSYIQVRVSSGGMRRGTDTQTDIQTAVTTTHFVSSTRNVMTNA